MTSDEIRITPEEERDLATKWRTGGDSAARERLILAFLGFPKWVIRKQFAGYVLRYPDLHDDMIASGNYGLIWAIDRFDPGRGIRLTTYAYRWIVHYVDRAVGKWLELGDRDLHTLAKADEFMKLIHDGVDPRQARDAVVTRKQKQHPASMVAAIQWSRPKVSLQKPVSTASYGRIDEFGDTIADGGELVIHRLERATMERDVRAAVANLPTQHRFVVESRMEGEAFDAIGVKLGVSREWVRVLNQQAAKMLRYKLKEYKEAS